MNNFFVLFIIGLVMVAVNQFHVPAETLFISDTTMVLGFLILVAFFGGRVTNLITLPRITGYILMGVLCGPWVLNFVHSSHLPKFVFIDELALALIAFTAGAELNLGLLRERLKSIFWIIVMQVVITFLLVSVVMYFSKSLVGVLDGQPPKFVLAFCFIVAIISVAKSPAETIAIIVETRARGKMTNTVLGITVLKDIIVILLFTVVLNLVKPLVLPDGEMSFSAITKLIIEIVSSILAGGFFGAIIIAYLRYVRQELLIFVLGMVFFITTISHQLHLEFLLTCITAGFVVENYSDYGHEFLNVVERGSLPVYLIFFSIAGANLNLPVLYKLWPIAVILVAARILSVFLGTYAGAKLANDDETIQKLAWAGFIGQAGVSLGFAIIVQKEMPLLGETIRNIIVASVVLNLMLGPVLFKRALQKAGEAYSGTIKRTAARS